MPFVEMLVFCETLWTVSPWPDVAKGPKIFQKDMVASPLLIQSCVKWQINYDVVEAHRVSLYYSIVR